MKAKSSLPIRLQQHSLLFLTESSSCSGFFAPHFTWKVYEWRVFCGSYFSVLGLNTEICRVNLCIQSKCRKKRTRKNYIFRVFSCILALWCLENVFRSLHSISPDIRCVDWKKNLTKFNLNIWPTFSFSRNYLWESGNKWVQKSSSSYISCQCFDLLNPFLVRVSILYPRFSGVFRWYKMDVSSIFFQF